MSDVHYRAGLHAADTAWKARLKVFVAKLRVKSAEWEYLGDSGENWCEEIARDLETEFLGGKRADE